MFRGMKYVYAVYKEQSFTRAAEKLYISQPSLSASIKRIEEELGAPLFERGYSPIRLTEVGREYIETTEKILKLQDDFQAKLNDMNNLEAGHLTIGGSNYVSSYISPKIVSVFSEKYPNIQISFVESYSVDLHHRLQNEELDLLIDSFDFSKSLYESYPIASEHIFLAVPARNKINEKLKVYRLNIDETFNIKTYEDAPPVPIELFRDEQFILLKNGNDMYKRASSFFSAGGFEPKVAFYMDQLITAYALVASDMGISFVTDTLIKYSRFKNTPCFYKLSGDEQCRTMYIAHKKNKYKSRLMSAFIETAQEVMLKTKGTVAFSADRSKA